MIEVKKNNVHKIIEPKYLQKYLGEGYQIVPSPIKEKEKPKKIVDVEENEVNTKNVDKLNQLEARTLARKLKIENYSSMHKKEIIEAIKEKLKEEE